MELRATGVAAIIERCKVNHDAGSWFKPDSLAVISAMLQHIAARVALPQTDIAEFMEVCDMVVNPAAAHGRFVDMKLLKDLGKKRSKGGDKYAALTAALAVTPPTPPTT